MSHRTYLSQIDDQIPRPNLDNFDQAVFVLHDQLNLRVWPEWIAEEQPLFIFVESVAKGTSLPYHKKKLTYVLSSMRHFALECHEEGFPVFYHATTEHYDGAIRELVESHDIELTYMKPSEWDSRERLREVKKEFPDRIEEIPNRFFFADPDRWKKNIGEGYRMEYFYRDMRRKTGYLMNGDDPKGGEWNYDEENRESLPKDYPVPEITGFEPDAITKEVIELVRDQFSNHFGQLEASDDWAEQVFRFEAEHGAATGRVVLRHRRDAVTEALEAAGGRVQRISRSEMLQWADAVYRQMPPLDPATVARVGDDLPETRARLRAGQTLRVVMLGDSIVNDTANSAWDLLVERHYPGSRIELIASVESAKGAWHYRKDNRIERQVLRHEPDLLIIGEAPGQEEDRRGEPFVGRAGQLLDRMLVAIGLDRDTVYITNVLKCRPPDNRDPKPEEVRACAGYLRRQIELIEPRAILSVGRISAQSLLETAAPIGRLRGEWHTYGPRSTPLLVTYHPAYLLRKPAEKRKAWTDLKAVRDHLRAGEGTD